MTILERIKIKLNIKDDTKDDLLTLLIDDATNYILNKTNRLTLLPTMNYLVENLAIEYYNQSNVMNTAIDNNTVGVKSESHSEGDISDSVTYYDISSTGNLYIPNQLQKEIGKYTRNIMCLYLEKEGKL